MAETPTLLQIGIHQPFRHGKSRAVSYGSWIHVGLSSFIITDAFDPPVQMLRVGDPVTGFVEGASSEDHFGAQLSGWAKTLDTEWKLLHAASFPGANRA